MCFVRLKELVALSRQTHLADALESAKIEVSPSAKAWEPLRTYQKRLLAAASKGKEKGEHIRGQRESLHCKSQGPSSPALVPAKGRKSKNSTGKSADEATSDDERSAHDPITDDDHPPSPPRPSLPQSLQRSARSAVKTYGRAAPQQEGNGTPTIPKARPKPRPKTIAVEAQAQAGSSPEGADGGPSKRAPALPVNGFGHHSPIASPTPAVSSPQAGPSQSNGAPSPTRSSISRSSKRKRAGEDVDEELEEEEAVVAAGLGHPAGDDDGDDDESDKEEDQGSPNLLKYKKHPRPPSSQISQMSQLDIDFFKTRKRVRR